jgi:hypothetical protein
VAFLFLIGLVGTSFAATKDPVPAPIPTQVRSARKIFIANGGNFVTGWDNLPRDIAYNVFYAGIKDWGRFELVPSPAEAELIFQIQFVDATGNANAPSTRQLRLLIIEPKGNITLWGVAEKCGFALLDSNKRHDFDAGMAALLSNLKTTITGAPEASKPATTGGKPSLF